MTMTRDDVLNRAAKACELTGWPDTAEQVRAIAALSAQEPFGFIEPETGNFCWLEDAKRCPKDAATYTLACYAAPPAQADTKRAEPLRVTREQLSAAWRAGLAATDKGCADWADEMLAALHQLGANVEVSDG